LALGSVIRSLFYVFRHRADHVDPNRLAPFKLVRLKAVKPARDPRFTIDVDYIDRG
jgi:hypothetical protein